MAERAGRPGPHPLLRGAARRRRRQDGDPHGLGRDAPRPRRRHLRRPARPRGPLPGRGAAGGVEGRPRRRRPRALRVRRGGGGRGRRPLGRHREREPRDGSGRSARSRDPDPLRGEDARLPDRGRDRHPRGGSPQAPLPRPAPAAPAAQPPPAPPGDDGGAAAPGRAGVLRDRDPDARQVDPGGRARLPRALARPPRQLLRAAAVAPALQAAADDLGPRQVLPDRPLLPRRGPARRPPARVHAGGRGDVVPAHGDGVRPRGAALPAGHGHHRCQGRSALPAPELRRGDAEVRLGQARPALRHADHRRERRAQGPGARQLPGLPGGRGARPRDRAAGRGRRLRHAPAQGQRGALAEPDRPRRPRGEAEPPHAESNGRDRRQAGREGRLGRGGPQAAREGRGAEGRHGPRGRRPARGRWRWRWASCASRWGAS